MVQDFQPKLEWLNTSPLSLKKVAMQHSSMKFSSPHAHDGVLNRLTNLAGSGRESGGAGFLDILLHQLYACTAGPGILGEEVSRSADDSGWSALSEIRQRERFRSDPKRGDPVRCHTSRGERWRDDHVEATGREFVAHFGCCESEREADCDAVWRRPSRGQLLLFIPTFLKPLSITVY